MGRREARGNGEMIRRRYFELHVPLRKHRLSRLPNTKARRRGTTVRLHGVFRHVESRLVEQKAEGNFPTDVGPTRIASLRGSECQTWCSCFDDIMWCGREGERGLRLNDIGFTCHPRET